MALIGTGDIATMLEVSREYATKTVTKRADFPAPVLKLSRKTVRWDRAAVMEWIEAQRIRASGRSARASRGSG